MAIIELPESPSVVRTPRQVTGTRVFRCDWNEQNDSSLPQYGDALDLLYPDARCVQIDVKRDDAFGAIVTCSYSTTGIYASGFMDIQIEVGVEALDTTRTCTWENAGTKVDIPVTTLHPFTEYTITLACATSPLESLQENVGRINDRIFHGAPVGTLLFEGANYGESRDVNGVLQTQQCSFRFLRLTRPQTEAWREARQKTVAGVPCIWEKGDPAQSDFASGIFYTDETNPSAYDNAIHMDGDPVYVLGPAGAPAWDKPYWMDDQAVKHYRYETCDFATVLGLPKFPGDA